MYVKYLFPKIVKTIGERLQTSCLLGISKLTEECEIKSGEGSRGYLLYTCSPGEAYAHHIFIRLNKMLFWSPLSFKAYIIISEKNNFYSKFIKATCSLNFSEILHIPCYLMTKHLTLIYCVPQSYGQFSILLYNIKFFVKILALVLNNSSINIHIHLNR